MVVEYINLCKMGCVTVKHTPFHIVHGLVVIMVMEGSLIFTTVAGDHVLQEGDIEILNVKEPVRLTAERESCRLLYVDFERQFVDSIRDDFEYITYNCNEGNFFGKRASEQHIETLKRKFLEFLADGVQKKDYLTMKKNALAMINFICANFDDIEHHFMESAEWSVSRERFKEISAYMVRHVSERITLKDIAQSIYLSVPYLSREFSLRLSKTCNEILNYYRTINAVIWLLDTNKSLTHIAENSGFSSPRYYNKAFAAALGMQPGKFRALNKGAKAEVRVEQLSPAEILTALQNLQQEKAAPKAVIHYPSDARSFSDTITNSGSAEIYYTIKVCLKPHEKLQIIKSEDLSK